MCRTGVNVPHWGAALPEALPGSFIKLMRCGMGWVMWAIGAAAVVLAAIVVTAVTGLERIAKAIDEEVE